MGTGAVGLAFASQTATFGWRWTMWIALAFLLFRPQGLFGDKIIERI